MSSLSVSKASDGVAYNKARLHELFALIEKEYELLWEENQECMYLHIVLVVTRYFTNAAYVHR